MRNQSELAMAKRAASRAAEEASAARQAYLILPAGPARQQALKDAWLADEKSMRLFAAYAKLRERDKSSVPAKEGGGVE